MGCTASVATRSTHGNKVVPDSGIARRSSSRSDAESTAECVAKVPLSAVSYLGLCKSDQAASSPKPRLKVMRVRSKSGADDKEQQTVEETSVEEPDLPSQEKGTPNGSRKGSLEAPQPSGPSASGLIAGGSSSKDLLADADTQEVAQPTIPLPGAAESPTAGAGATAMKLSPHPASTGLSGSNEAAAEETATEQLPPPASDPVTVTRLGITLSGLRKLYDALRDRFGPQRLWGMSTEELARVWVAETTSGQRCRLLEAAGIVDPCDVAPPVYFISHCWQNRAALLFESVLGHYLLGGRDADSDADAGITASEDGLTAVSPAAPVTVWIDLLAVNQHEGTEERRLDLAAVQDVVRACSGGTIAITDLAAGVNPASRAWILYEWATSLATHGLDALHIQLDPYERSSIIGGLDIRQASCKNVADKAMIQAAIAASYGSSEAFNTQLRLQLLLQPLSYREDLRRRALPPPAAAASSGRSRLGMSLPQPAAAAPPSPTTRLASTGWDFSPVRSWLDAGEEGSRVLCLLGGSGEGKSTLCAALCDPEVGLLRAVDGGRGRIVGAHHFVRFGDRRRQEPLRIIKSLAYQLAEGLPLLSNYVLQLDAAEVAQLAPDGSAAFEELMLKPLSAGLGTGQVVILIDGLDEADPPTPLGQAPPPPLLLPPSPRRLPAPLLGSDAAAALLLSPSARGSRVHLLPPTSPSAAANGALAAAGAATVSLPVCGNKVVQLLAKQLRSLPTFVRFIVSTDPGAMGGHVRAALDRAFADCGGVSYMTPQQLRCRPRPALPAMADNDDGGFAAAAGVSPGRGGGSAAAAGNSGVLLYHTVMNECLGGVAAAAAAMAAKPPPAAKPVLPPLAAATVADLHAAYSQLFTAGMSRLGKSDQEAVRALLEVLLAAQEPLPVSLLAAMGLAGALRLLPGYQVLIAGPPSGGDGDSHGDGGDADEDPEGGAGRLENGLHTARSVFSSPERRHTVRILHKSLADWLADPRVSGPLLATSPARGHARLARYLFTQVVAAASYSAPPTGSVSQLQLPNSPRAAATCRTPSPYALTYLVRHLVAGGDRESLDALLQHYGFLAAVLSRGLGQSLLRDMLSLPGPTPLVCDMLRWLPEQQAVLVGTLTGEDVLGNLLQHCPVGSVAFQAAQQHILAEAAAAGRPGWRLRHGLGLPRNWPALRGMLEGHSRVVMAVAWSPDGRTLASGSGDATVRLWEAASGECIATLEGHISDVQAVAWSPSGGALASGGNDGNVKLWDMATGDCVATLMLSQPGEEVRSVAWSCDGRALASGSNMGEVRVWDAASGECVLVLEGHVDAVLSVAWSPRGGILASGGEDETVRLWHPASGQCTATMLGHAGCVRKVAWNPDGRTLASGSDDATIRLWDTSSGDCTSTLEGHSWPVTCVCWSPDGRDLVSGSTDQTIRIWDAGSGLCLGGLEEFSYSVSWSPDGRTLASGGSIDPSVRLWDVAATIGAAEETGGSGGAQQGHSDIVNSLAWTPDGKTLASGSDDRTIRLWDATTGECTSTLEGPLDRVFAVAWSPDGRTLASGSRDMGVRLWNAKSGGCTSVFKGHLDTVYSVAWSPNGTVLASGSGDKTIRLWNATSGQCIATLEGHQDTVWSVAWSPDGKTMASGSIDATVRLWDSEAARCITKMDGHSSEVRSVAWCPDGKTLASGSIDMTIRLWDTSRGNCAAVLRVRWLLWERARGTAGRMV
ncbi:hypothetical protein Vafri_11626 [Volvox africanus]|uniref:Nephrocystin 3-like N-terminal domain-containing protein n=2 Tax=Volvox africanus TaxID=51714 RepID=A0A8J4BD68_9CHLO|nr:hypothetical protein Vafri_11626 [Volvox africanus]